MRRLLASALLLSLTLFLCGCSSDPTGPERKAAPGQDKVDKGSKNVAPPPPPPPPLPGK